MTEWRREQRPVERIERLELDDLAGRLESEPQTHRRVEVRLADRSDCRSTPSTCSWLTPARPPAASELFRPAAGARSGHTPRQLARITGSACTSPLSVRSSKPAGRGSPTLGWFDSIAAP